MNHHNCNKVFLYKNNYDIEELIHNLQMDEVHIIIWQHKKIPDIVRKIIPEGIIPSYPDIYKKILKSTIKICQKPIKIKNYKNLTFCHEKYLDINMKFRHKSIKKNIEYSLIWDINLENLQYSIYPSFSIEKKKDRYRYCSLL
jgi:hypothetical protein